MTPPPEPTTNAELIAAARSTTEEMAHFCSVDMELWDRHSNAVLALADALQASEARETSGEKLARYEAALAEIARIGVNMSSDFSRSAKQSEIARAALSATGG